MRDHGLRGMQRLLPQRAVWMRAQRVGVQQVERVQVAVGEAAGDLGRAAARLGQRRVAGAVTGGEAGLAQAAPVRARRDLEQARAGARGEPEPRREVQQRARRDVAAGAGQQALAVDDHDVLTGGGQCLDERADGVGARAGGARGAAEVADVVGERGVERDQQRRGAVWRGAQDGVGARVERGRAGAGDGHADAVAPHALADPQVEDRGVVDGV